MILSEMLVSTTKRGRELRVKYQKPLRFIFIGAINTLASYLIFIAMYVALKEHNTALIIATGLGIIFNYFTTGRIVFGNGGLGAFAPFVIVYAVTISINIVLLNILLYIDFRPPIGQAVCIPVVATISYFLNSRYVFK